ncbi:hypothetical protein MSG28_008997 [Choristoneura fumiferana]|uniref:Uncharacterized protein n=1 Tax=Choristoneura fumiferana TaxID=7141 RepID=A0ACC0J945_CHOFU|nr:hypothetical protein MSG28_008997 [Choristoneura fumiferana]
MDGLGETSLEHLGLETALQEVLDLQTEHVIELHLFLIQHSDADQPTEERGQQLTGSLTDARQGVLDPPHFTLVAETIFANDFQLLVETGLLERAAGCDIGLGKDRRYSVVHHDELKEREFQNIKEYKNMTTNPRKGTDPVPLEESDQLTIRPFFHLDHSGALPWFLTKTSFKGRVFMTHATKAIYRWLVSDYIKVSNISTEQMLYTESDLENSMDRIETVNFHEERDVRGVRFWAYNAGHVLGAAMFMIEIAGVKVLYTGDFSRQEDRHLMAAEIPTVHPDVLITGIDHFEDIGPCVILASPGMMQSGLSRELFESWCTDPKNGVMGSLAMDPPEEGKQLQGILECVIEMLQEMYGEDSVPKMFKGDKLHVLVDSKRADIDLYSMAAAGGLRRLGVPFPVAAHVVVAGARDDHGARALRLPLSKVSKVKVTPGHESGVQQYPHGVRADALGLRGAHHVVQHALPALQRVRVQECHVSGLAVRL